MNTNSIPVGSSYTYSTPQTQLADWQTSDYQQKYSYWNYDLQKQLDYVKGEIERIKYEYSGYNQAYTGNEAKINDLVRYKDYYKNELYRLNNELNTASDQKTRAEARRYTVKDKMDSTKGDERHALCREKEQLDTEIWRLADVISTAQWKINDMNSNLNSTVSQIEQRKNENYRTRELAANLNYKYQELTNELNRLEALKAQG